MTFTKWLNLIMWLKKIRDQRAKNRQWRRTKEKAKKEKGGEEGKKS